MKLLVKLQLALSDFLRTSRRLFLAHSNSRRNGVRMKRIPLSKDATAILFGNVMLFWILYKVVRKTAHRLLLCHGPLLNELPLKRSNFGLEILFRRQVSDSFVLYLVKLFTKFVHFHILLVDLSDEIFVGFVLVVIIIILAHFELLYLLQLCLILLLKEFEGYLFLVLTSWLYSHLVVDIFGELCRLRHDARSLTHVVASFLTQVFGLEGGQLDLFDPVFFFLFFSLWFELLNVLVSFG